MNMDPALTQKLLGDGFYEQRILREQIAQLTGRRFLNGYSNDQTQYQALMNNAATFAREHNLRPGIALAADNAITLKAAQSASEQHSSNNASSGSVGFSVGSSGFIANASFSKRKGKGDGSDVTNTLTQVNAGNQLTITSGSDTNLQGAVVTGKQVTMEVGKNLNIESVQDLSTYKGRQESFGGSFSFGAGKNTGSINSSQSHVDGTYASVTEQSGIIAGDGGFNIKVNGNTDLKGGKIASTEQAATNGKNSLTTNTLTQSNIQNKDSYQAESTSASFGSGGSMGYGSSSSNASSVTESGISAGKVTIKDDAAQQAKTGKTAAETIASINTQVTEKDSSGKLTKDWNGQQLIEDVTAQAQIMQSFGSQAAKAIGDYALKKENEIRGKLGNEKDPQKIAALNDELKSWGEGGSNRVLLHTAAGALSGDIGGALGAAASATAMPHLSKKIAAMQLPEAMQKGLEQVTATALGAVVGGNAGAAVSLNVDANNRQLHQIEIDMIKKNAARFAKQFYGTANPTQEQITGAIALLANTAQNLVDYNFGYNVPYSKQAEAFLHTLQLEYAATNPNLSLGNGQILFYATPDQMNSPYINSGTVDKEISGFIIKAPIKPQGKENAYVIKRDPATNLILDEKGKYSRHVVIEDKIYEPKYFPCPVASMGCSGKNLDISDPGTMAYVRALDKKTFDDIGKALTLTSIANPVGAGGTVAGYLGPLVSMLGGLTNGDAVSAGSKEIVGRAAQEYMQNVLKIPPALSVQITSLIDLGGGWQAFVDRTKNEFSNDKGKK